VTLNYVAEDRRTAGFAARDERCAQLISICVVQMSDLGIGGLHIRPEGSTSRAIQGVHAYSSAEELS
jgi:hypothetical protein